MLSCSVRTHAREGKCLRKMVNMAKWEEMSLLASTRL